MHNIEPLTIGREPGNQIVVAHSSVSRQHARITPLASGAFQLTDLASTNGTWCLIEGRKQRIDGSALVQRDSFVIIGEVEILVSDLMLMAQSASPDVSPASGGEAVADDPRFIPTNDMAPPGEEAPDSGAPDGADEVPSLDPLPEPAEEAVEAPPLAPDKRERFVRKPPPEDPSLVKPIALGIVGFAALGALGYLLWPSAQSTFESRCAGIIAGESAKTACTCMADTIVARLGMDELSALNSALAGIDPGPDAQASAASQARAGKLGGKTASSNWLQAEKVCLTK